VKFKNMYQERGKRKRKEEREEKKKVRK